MAQWVNALATMLDSLSLFTRIYTMERKTPAGSPLTSSHHCDMLTCVHMHAGTHAHCSVLIWKLFEKVA